MTALYCKVTATFLRHHIVILRQSQQSKIVGYDTNGLRDNARKAVGPTFLKVDGSDITFGDLKVVGLEGKDGEGITVSFQILDGVGRAVDNMSYYWYEYDYSAGEPHSGKEFDEWCYGWYDMGCSKCYNDEKIAAGEGLWVKSSDSKYSIQCAGVVPVAPISVVLRDNARKLVANPMPSEMTFGDMWITGLKDKDGESITVSFQILDGVGRAVDNMSYYWYDYDYSSGNPRSGKEIDDWCYGWYDMQCSKPYNNEPLEAGQALWMKSSSSKYSVNFKSPLNK